MRFSVILLLALSSAALLSAVSAEANNTVTADSSSSSRQRCGSKASNPHCPEGQCCSKHGRCGTSKSYCSLDRGCREAYGKCLPGSAWKPQCGKKAKGASCPHGGCCSQYGFCGTSADYCAAGCQGRYGACDDEHVPQGNEQCGPAAGGASCAVSGSCCSRWGYCGFDTLHCDAGCQHAYGKCNWSRGLRGPE